jgi:hypothetical protein
LCFSSFSEVRGSPGPGTAAFSFEDEFVELGREIGSAEGDVDRVMDGFAVIESAVDAAVEREVFEAVRRAEAARRGRGADGLMLAVVVEVLCAALLLLIRAASAPREGMRLAGLEVSGVEFELIVEGVERTLRSPSNNY